MRGSSDPAGRGGGAAPARYASAMRLILVRHAKTFERDPERWPNDAERPLTSEGRKEFAGVAKKLGRIQGKVDLVMASPAVRAWQTAELLHERAGWPLPTRCETLAPEGDPGDGVSSEPASASAATATNQAGEWTKLLAGLADDAVVVWVGHEPTLGRIASSLLCGCLSGEPGRVHIRFKKGAALAIERERGLHSLAWMVTPRLIQAL